MRINSYIAIIGAGLSACTVLCANAQLVLDRTVISPFAFNASAGGIDVFSTGGQPAFETIGQPNFFLTQGFEQPLQTFPAGFDVTSQFNRCTGQYEVLLTSLTGCAASGATWLWNGTAGDSLFTTSDPLVELEVFGALGCFTSGIIDVSGSPIYTGNCPLLFYSFFSPNGDGFNDTWIIEHVSSPLYGSNEVIILNRWGQEVWKATGYNNADVVFRGETDSGKVLPDGTYFYFVTLGGEQYSGYIELQR